MARPLRVEFPGAWYLVTVRGLPRQKVFRDEEDVERFLQGLPAVCDSLGPSVHGFCLLPDRYHLLIETPAGNLSRVMHRLNAGHSAFVNAKRRRRGPILRSRYRSVVLDPMEWLVDVSIHLHLRPVFRGLSEDPWSFHGSSARAFLPGAPPMAGLTTTRVLERAGGAATYRDRLQAAMSEERTPPWERAWRGLVLGPESLKAQAEKALEGKDPREIPNFSSGSTGIPLDFIVEAVAEGTGVRREEVLKGKFQRVLARKVGLYLARRFSGLTLKEIGKAFEVDYTTVHMAVRRLEELRRSDPAVDELVRDLEEGIRRSQPALPGETGARRPRKRRKKRETPEPRDAEEGAQLKLF